jgi:hypothetical protein
VFCGETALFLRGLPVVKVPPTIDVATPSTTRLGVRPSSFAVRGTAERSVRALGSAPPPLRRHFHATVTPQEVRGCLAVPVAEALVETMVHAKLARALTVADGVLRLDDEAPLLDREPVLEAIAALRYATHRRRCEAIASLARAGAESPGESVSRALMLRFGFPEPVLQCEYADGQGRLGRTDFTWRSGPQATPTPSGKERVGESDGWGKYFDSGLTGGEDPVAVVKREKRRENRLLALGHPVLRWTWAELEQPGQVPLDAPQRRAAGLPERGFRAVVHATLAPQPSKFRFSPRPRREVHFSPWSPRKVDFTANRGLRGCGARPGPAPGPGGFGLDTGAVLRY